MASDNPEIFDRHLRRIRRDRAARRGLGGFLHAHLRDELLARLDDVTRRFSRALIIGSDDVLRDALAGRGTATIAVDCGFAYARAAGGVQCDEDRLPFSDASVDLVLWPGGLESVNDVPGALALARRILIPDGLLLAGFVGGGSLPMLRAAMLAADLEQHGGASPRLHPQIDVRAAGDLVQRAGLMLPVIDAERLDVRYRSLATLIADLRDAGAGNLLSRGPPLARFGLAAAHTAFAAAADADGRTTERFELVYLTAWSPSPSQPQPARRGSATTSLAASIGRRD
jgi:NADH dehydrogenase [ubiquinone] 1 alpha subcomplex assembly factor 5